MDQAQLTTLLTGAGGGGSLLMLGRWAMKLWADVRRETIVATAARQKEQIDAAKEARNEQREMNEKMVHALLEQTRSNTALEHSNRELGGKLDALVRRLDDLEWRNTPVEGVPIADPTPIPRRASTHGDPPSERRRHAAGESSPVRFPGDRPPRPGR